MELDNIIFVDKPSGITSFDVIRRLRKIIGNKKMGHAGTLDPLATGLMIIAQGAATKTLSIFLSLPKTYRATVRFGIRTTTDDITGGVVESLPVPELSLITIQKVLDDMVGDNPLPVPKYSAIKKNGKPLYAYAREGEDVEVPIKNMFVESATCESYSEYDAVIHFSVGSGTYIRSLAVELGKRLGTTGTIVALRRLTIGKWSVDDTNVITV